MAEFGWFNKWFSIAISWIEYKKFEEIKDIDTKVFGSIIEWVDGYDI